ncbi:hypothetical protein TYRP_015445 [Tyrophagus putrescentiae]|nr:hypothetical protein TYRP_015445 [Tyrophagus putrescentiae]
MVEVAFTPEEPLTMRMRIAGLVDTSGCCWEMMGAGERVPVLAIVDLHVADQLLLALHRLAAHPTAVADGEEVRHLVLLQRGLVAEAPRTLVLLEDEGHRAVVALVAASVVPTSAASASSSSSASPLPPLLFLKPFPPSG